MKWVKIEQNSANVIGPGYNQFGKISKRKTLSNSPMWMAKKSNTAC